MPCAVGTNRRPGQGTAPSPYDDHDHDTETSTSTNFPQSFAPRGPSTLQSRIRDRLPQPLRIHARHGSIARIHTACSVRGAPCLSRTCSLTRHRKPSTPASAAQTTNASSSSSATSSSLPSCSASKEACAHPSFPASRPTDAPALTSSRSPG